VNLYKSPHQNLLCWRVRAVHGGDYQTAELSVSGKIPSAFRKKHLNFFFQEFGDAAIGIKEIHIRQCKR
jgi:hypothetical protein